MKKKVIKYGNSFVISFTRFEREIYGIKEGSILDLSEMIVIKLKEVNNNGNKKRGA